MIHRDIARRLTTLGLLLASSAQAAQAQAPSFGPLTYEEGGPLNSISYNPMTERLETVARGQWGADLWLGYSNLFEQDSAATHELFFDMERLTTVFTVRRGVSDRLEVGGRLAFATTGGGILDSFIIWWHEKLNLGNANRERYPRDDYAERFEGPDNLLLIDVASRKFGLENVRLFTKWHALSSEDGRSGLSLKAVASIPRGRNRVGVDRADVALVVIGRMARNRWYFHGTAAGSTLRSTLELDGILRSGTAFFMLGAERSLGEGYSALVQYSVSTPVFRGFRNREVDQPSANLIMGVAGRWGTDWRWEASFQEDLPADTPAIDFTLGLRLSRVW
jgi:Protein of unknown function (DUF3187)